MIVPTWLFWLLVIWPVIVAAQRAYSQRRRWVALLDANGSVLVKAGYAVKRGSDGSIWIVGGWWGKPRGVELGKYW